MKISSDSQFRDPSFSTYAESMADHIRKTMVKKPPTTVQAASTQSTLERNPLDDLKHQSRPLPTNWKAVPNAKTLKEAVGERHLDFDEISHFEATRRRSKNTQGHSTRSAKTPENRERGVQAFIYTPPANVTKEEIKDRAVNLVQYKSEPMKEEWVEMTWFQALLHRIKGNKIKSETKPK